MSYSVDVNILLYASDSSSRHNTAALRFLEERSSETELFCLAWPVIMAYLRISTHPRIFATPLAPKMALANIEALLSLPKVRVIGEAEGFLEAYKEATSGLSVRGNLVPDAHLAALLRQHEVRVLYTNDLDFRKFGFLEVRSLF